MNQITTWLDSINRTVGAVVRWFALMMVLIQFFIVILRYALGYSDTMINESVLYLHVGLFMLGAGYTLLVDGHVRVDIFYAKAPLRIKALIDIFGHLFLLMPSMMALMYWSWPSVYNAWKIKEGAISVGGIPAIWVMKLLIPAFCVLLIVQSISCLIKQLMVFSTHNSSQNPPEVS